MFGPLAIEVDGRRLGGADLGGRKPKQILEILLVHLGQPVPKDRIAELLWGERLPRDPMRTLEAYVSGLRARLHPDPARARALLRSDPGAYLVPLDAAEVDLWQFDDLVAQSPRAAIAERLELRSRALALVRGDVLADEPYADWLMPLRDDYAERHSQVRLDLAEDCLAAGRPERTLREATAVLASQPTRERAHRLVIAAHYAQGEQDLALRAYDTCRQILVEQLGVSPLAETEQLYLAVLNQDPVAPPADEDVPAPAPEGLVGRAAELAELRAAVDATADGRGGVVLVAGEPGIGKTAFLRAVAAAAAARSLHVLWADCWQGAGTPAYWPWIQVLRVLPPDPDRQRLLGELGDPQLSPADDRPDVGAADGVEADQARFRLFDAVAGHLAATAERAATAILLDDLQWADAASLQLLDFVARTAAASGPLLIVGAYRDTDVGPEHPLRRLAGALASQLRVMTLPGLDDSGVGEMIRAVAGSPAAPEVVAAVRERTGGNPLFVREVVGLLAAEHGFPAPGTEHHLRAVVPPTVRELLGEQLLALAPQSVQILRVAAIASPTLAIDVLAAACGADRLAVLNALEEGRARRLLRPGTGAAGSYAFSHDLVREATYDAIGVDERARLHRRIGEILEGRADASARRAELAHHFVAGVAAGGADKALAYSVEAGKRALEVYAHEDAVRHFVAALDVLGAAGGDLAARGELLVQLGNVRWRSGDVDGAVEALLEAAALGRELGDPVMLAKAALGYGDATRGSYDDVDRRLIEWHEEALAALPPDDSVLRVRLLSRLSEDLYWARGDRRDALSREAVAMARRLGDPAALRTALYTRYYAVLGPGSLEERRANADEVLALATQVGDPEGRFAGHELRAATLMETDEVDRLDAEIDACARLADELRLPILRWRTLAFRASRALMSGRLDEAEQLVDAALAAFQPVPSDVALAVYGAQLFMLRYLQGRLAELEEMLRQYAAERTDPAFSAGLAFVYSELGKPAEARQQLAAVADGFEEAAQTAGYLTTLWLATHVAVAVGEPDQAAALYERLVPYAERTVTAAYALRMGGVATLLGMLATALGDCDTATRHFDAAVAHERRAASPPALALALREQAAMPRGRGTPGDADRARVLLDEALTLIDRFGLEGLRPREQALRDQWG